MPTGASGQTERAPAFACCDSAWQNCHFAALRGCRREAWPEREWPLRAKTAIVAALVIILTLSGPLTAFGAEKHPARQPAKAARRSHHRHRGALPLPPRASAALARLMQAALQVAQERERVGALSERYDETELAVRAAEGRVRSLSTRLRRTKARVRAERTRLRTAAVEAYVTGQTSAIDDSLLTSAVSDGAMVGVYAQVATGHVSSVLHLYSRAVRTDHLLVRSARSNSLTIRRAAARTARLRRQALLLEDRTAATVRAIRANLSRLVGRKQFSRLTSDLPAGSPYRGKNLAGTDVSKVASGTAGLRAVAAAKKLLGVPYVWGGASKAGVDCSGLTMLAWTAAGISLEHSATVQWEESKPVPLRALEPGDLLFYHFRDDGGTPITHVVMYVGTGPYGRSTIIQAAHTGTNVSYSPMFVTGLVSAGRP